MTTPFIFIATNKLREGRFEDEQRRVPDLVSFIEASEPRLLAFNEYANADRTEVAVVQVHPDAESMEFHMRAVGERALLAYAQTIEATVSVQVFGTPTDQVLQMLSRQAGSGVPVAVKPYHLGGFTRPHAG
jgi:hypothetical protein